MWLTKILRGWRRKQLQKRYNKSSSDYQNLSGEQQYSLISTGQDPVALWENEELGPTDGLIKPWSKERRKEKNEE